MTTVAGIPNVSPYNWDDGYTVSLGVGRAFNENVSGSISIGYDSGVSRGSETTYTDIYTLSGGVSLKNNKWAELRFGGLVGYWTGGEQSERQSGCAFQCDGRRRLGLCGKCLAEAQLLTVVLPINERLRPASSGAFCVAARNQLVRKVAEGHSVE